MKAVNIFLGADLRCGIDGLKALAKKHKVDFGALDKLEALVFVNTQRNKMKVLSYNNVVHYLRCVDQDRPLDIEALNEIPRAINSDGTVDYTKALRLSLVSRLAKKGRFKDLEVI